MRRKILLLLSMIFCFNTINAKIIEINIKDRKPTTAPRSLSHIPKATICDTDFELFIQFSIPTKEQFVVTISDNRGNVIYRSIYVSGNDEQSYTVGTLDNGLYTLSLESDTKLYNGEFLIEK